MLGDGGGDYYEGKKKPKAEENREGQWNRGVLGCRGGTNSKEGSGVLGVLYLQLPLPS